MRDKNWEEEFTKWRAKTLYKRLDRCCYVSANKIKNKKYDLVILDEAHNITENNALFFENNEISNILALTATPPTDIDKQLILHSLGVTTTYTLTLDQGIDLGVVSPYEIEIIEIPLDSKDKYIKSGSKKKRFYQTEFDKYQYLSERIRKLMFSNDKKDTLKFMLFNRMRFIYNLKSKTDTARGVLDTIPESERTLIFCGSIKQAEELCKFSYHSKNEKLKNFDKFCNGEINRLASVQKLNEGVNIPNVDNVVIVQLNSRDLHLIQRIGRAVRFRDNHTAKIYILSSIGTQDEKWVQRALESFDPSKIKYSSYKTYLK